MGIDKFLEKIGVSKSEDKIEEEQVQEAAEPEAKAPETPAEPKGNFSGNAGGFGKAPSSSSKVVGIGSTVSSIREAGGGVHKAQHGPDMKVVVIQPRSLDDSQQIANCLKEKRPVVINFEGVDDQLYRRILDFVSGTTYALDGSVNSISTRVWLFSPKNVNVSVSKQTNQSYSDMPWEKK